MNYIPDFPMPSNNIPITIYYLPHCGFSQKALNALQNFRDKKGNPLLYKTCNAEVIMAHLLMKKGNKNVTKELVDKKGRQLFFPMLDKYTNKYRSFPLIFIKNNFIGGCSELLMILNEL